MLARFLLSVCAIAVALSACSDDDAATRGGSYALQKARDWQLQEAVDPRADDPVAASDRPPMDWYAEYVRASQTEMVRLSGHEASLEESRAALEAVGFRFNTVRIAGHKEALVGTSDIEESGPALLLVKARSRTFMMLSYDVDGDVLVEFAQTVEAADEDEWVSAGGVVR